MRLYQLEVYFCEKNHKSEYNNMQPFSILSIEQCDMLPLCHGEVIILSGHECIGHQACANHTLHELRHSFSNRKQFINNQLMNVIIFVFCLKTVCTLNGPLKEKKKYIWCEVTQKVSCKTSQSIHFIRQKYKFTAIWAPFKHANQPAAGSVCWAEVSWLLDGESLFLGSDGMDEWHSSSLLVARRLSKNACTFSTAFGEVGRLDGSTSTPFSTSCTSIGDPMSSLVGVDGLLTERYVDIKKVRGLQWFPFWLFWYYFGQGWIQ